MTPMKIYWSLKDWLLAEEALDVSRQNGSLDHPDLQTMTLRQLADLPFPGHFRPAAHPERLPLAKCA